MKGFQKETGNSFTCEPGYCWYIMQYEWRIYDSPQNRQSLPLEKFKSNRMIKLLPGMRDLFNPVSGQRMQQMTFWGPNNHILNGRSDHFLSWPVDKENSCFPFSVLFQAEQAAVEINILGKTDPVQRVCHPERAEVRKYYLPHSVDCLLDGKKRSLTEEKV